VKVLQFLEGVSRDGGTACTLHQEIDDLDCSGCIGWQWLKISQETSALEPSSVLIGKNEIRVCPVRPHVCAPWR